MKTAIVTPAANEIAHISSVYQQLKALRDPNLVWIVVVNNVCVDGTDKWLQAQRDPHIIVHHNGADCSLAHAYLTGIQVALDADCDIIIELDIGHPVDKIPAFQAELKSTPLVVGTRYGKHAGFVDTAMRRQLLSCVGTYVSQRLLGLPFSDCTSGLQGFTRHLAQQLPFNRFLSSAYFYQTEFKFYCRKVPFVEIPFVYRGGTTLINKHALLESLTILPRLCVSNTFVAL